jgi:DnaJ-class molecular chaperone
MPNDMVKDEVVELLGRIAVALEKISAATARTAVACEITAEGTMREPCSKCKGKKTTTTNVSGILVEVECPRCKGTGVEP